MISVVVPLYNYRRYIEDNIRSIQKQTFKNWEMIIVDDGSTDAPQEVISPYLDDRVHYIRIEQNGGYSNAKNVGIRRSKGDAIVVLDADDMLTPDSLEVRYKYLTRHKDKYWVHAKAYEFSGNKPYRFEYRERKAIRNLRAILKSKQFDQLWNNIHAQTVMVKRSAYEQIGLYEPELRSMGDKEMWARIQFNLGLPGYLDHFVAYYRQHGQQMHRSKWKLAHKKQYKRLLNKLINERKHGNVSGCVTL